MLKQAIDFKNESDYLFSILKKLSDADFNEKTLFKEWTFNDIIRHLHVWNHAANLSISKNNKDWKEFSHKVNFYLNNGKTLNDFEKNFVKKLKGKQLLSVWKDLYEKVSENFKKENPKKRVKWVGPDMSIISSISARHMETWAHSQAIYDKLGLVRANNDRILNIVIIGNNTFKWSYIVNNLDIPKQIPFLKLISPSGKLWEFNKKQTNNYISGKAEDFCKVVTQVRNIKDVGLELKGSIAKKWMKVAQCFAGKASAPPKPGFRKLIKP